MNTYKKEKVYTLEDLKTIFIEERKTIQEMVNKATHYGMRETIDYVFEKFIDEIILVNNEDEFDQLIRNSLRMSFDDWFSGLR